MVRQLKRQATRQLTHLSTVKQFVNSNKDMKELFNLKSYFTFLSRNKIYTAINVFGLSVALMFVMLLRLPEHLIWNRIPKFRPNSLK